MPMASVSSVRSVDSAASAAQAISETSVSDPTGPASLLDVLKCPIRSELSRKRKIEKATTASANKKHKAGASNITDPKTVQPSTRVKQFPGECLAVRGGKLFCTACREELATKKSTVKAHVSTGDKHLKAKKRLESKAAKERDLREVLQAYDREVQPAGTTVSMDERVYRAKVVEQFLQAGIPIAKIDSLRGLLEENALKLTHSSHLADYIPPLLKREKQAIREEIQDKDVSVIP